MSHALQDLLACLVAAGSLGAMIFFSAVVAPGVFRTLPAEHAGRFLRGLFPHYFLLNGGAAILSAALSKETIAAALFAGGGVAMLLVRFLLIPRINAARDTMLGGSEAAAKSFHRLHGVSVAVNVLEMIALVVGIAVTARL